MLPACNTKAMLFTSMRSQPKSLRALTLFSSSIKPGGMAPRPSRFQTTSRSCSSPRAHPNSTAKKISGNSCGRTGCRTEFSNPSTTPSITTATQHAHRSAVENHVHRPPRLGCRRSLNLRIGISGQDDIAPTRADSITVRPDTAPGGRRRSFAMLHAPGSGIVEVLDCRCVATMPH